VTFDPVPLYIICVRLGPSISGVYVRARVLVPLKPGCDTRDNVLSRRDVLYTTIYLFSFIYFVIEYHTYTITSIGSNGRALCELGVFSHR
jgi:hypothetical protein